MRDTIGVSKNPMTVTAAEAENDTAKFCTNEPGCRSAVSVVRDVCFKR